MKDFCLWNAKDHRDKDSFKMIKFETKNKSLIISIVSIHQQFKSFLLSSKYLRQSTQNYNFVFFTYSLFVNLRIILRRQKKERIVCMSISWWKNKTKEHNDINGKFFFVCSHDRDIIRTETRKSHCKWHRKDEEKEENDVMSFFLNRPFFFLTMLLDNL
jgi:hypothetical protein